MGSRLQKNIVILLLSVIIITTAIILFFEFKRSNGKFINCGLSSINSGPKSIGGEFNLINGDGEYVSEKDVLNKVSLVYFGYTYCPDVCPFDLARNASSVEMLKDFDIDINMVFITIDPERDSPKVASQFAKFFHPDAIGLSGTKKDVENAKEKYFVFSSKNDSKKDQDYLMNHSTFTYLMHPKRGFLTFFNRKAKASDIAEKIMCIQKTK